MIDDFIFDLALRGDLERWRDRNNTATLVALKDSVRDEALALQSELRAEVRDAGLGEGVANAWRLEVFPSGNKLAWEPSAFLHSKAATIVDSFTRGGTIGPKNGQGLAVPIPGSPASTLRLRPGQHIVQIAEARWGKMVPVMTKKGTLMLVAQLRVTQSGRISKRGFRKLKSGARTQQESNLSVPMFWIVKQVRLEKKLDWQVRAQQAESGFASGVMRRLETRYQAAAREGVPE